MGQVAARIAYDTDGREDREQRLARRADELAALDPAEYPYASKSSSPPGRRITALAVIRRRRYGVHSGSRPR